MDSAKYRNLFQYLKNKVYPEGFTKQDKTTLQKLAKKFEYDSKLESLFYVAKEKDGTALRRLVIAEEDKARVFEECHSAPFSGHAGRDKTWLSLLAGFYPRHAFPLHCRFFWGGIVTPPTVISDDFRPL